tara:strand:+ start:2543 stop:2932 length:390 start_codon:yes stop_codon:yes gene_type:complete
MYSAIKEYYVFLKKQKEEKKNQLSMTTNLINQQMDNFMSQHGWERKGKGQKVVYVKKFNGRDITIGFRCNCGDSLGDGGLPEFLHDRLIPDTLEKMKMRHFHWNDCNTSGWSLDVVMERMEVFYNRYTQ